MEHLTPKLKHLVFAISKSIKMDLEHRFAKAEVKITPFQFAVLKHIKTGQFTANGLAGHLSIKPPSLVPVLDALSKGGYIAKSHDKLDRRKIHLSLTGKGQYLLNHISCSDQSDLLYHALRKLGQKKASSLIALLSELSANLEK